MKLAILISLIFNMVTYLLVLIVWFKDCKIIGKNNLAIPLKDRLTNTFLFITMPCILGLLLR